jgi:DNA-binding NarL/FixJ family response regulator
VIGGSFLGVRRKQMKILPPRQIEILKMLSFGLTNQEIATALNIEKKLLKRIFKKYIKI